MQDNWSLKFDSGSFQFLSSWAFLGKKRKKKKEGEERKCPKEKKGSITLIPSQVCSKMAWF